MKFPQGEGPTSTPRYTLAAPARLIAALWTFAILLSAIGIVSAASRARTVMTVASRPHTGALAKTDSLSGQMVVQLEGWTTPQDQSTYFAFMHSFADTWDDHPRYALLHLIPGALMLLLMPLQFVRRIRDRYINYHRWAGRTILTLGAGIAISAIFFGVLNPTVPGIEEWPIGLFTALLVYCGTRGFIAIRRKHVDEHRRWMIRTYAICASIAVVRLVAFPLAFVFRRPEQGGVALMTSFWIGWILTLAGAEWWLRRTEHADVTVGVLPSGAASSP